MKNQGNKRVYIIGSKGIPANYGGFETFIDKLVSGRTADIQYVVTGMSKEKTKEYTYKGARCVQFATGNTASARMMHTLKALWFVNNDASTTPGEKIVYILGARAGIFLPFFRPFLRHHNVTIFSNPDGAEWKRAKWSPIAKLIVFIFEWLLVKFSDLVICDSMAIKAMMKKDFRISENKLAFAAYGSDIYYAPENLPPKTGKTLAGWMKKNQIGERPYFLMVGRFVPENNYELIIREFMASDVDADLVIISNISDGKLKTLLYDELKVNRDDRIKLVGVMYDQDVLKQIRANATGYIHGHEVGGTNPSLLEALGSTNINIVYDVPFNREVAQDAALYFNSSNHSLHKALTKALSLKRNQALDLGSRAKLRIKSAYSWPSIIADYEKLFFRGKQDF